MHKGPEDGQSKKSKKDSDGKTDPHNLEPKRQKAEDQPARVLLPSVSTAPAMKNTISDHEILVAEQSRIAEEKKYPHSIITDIHKVGSIDSLLHNQASKPEKLAIYVNLLRFMGTVGEAKQILAKRGKKDHAKLLLAKLQSVAYFLGEEDLNMKLLSLVNNRIQEIGKEIIKVLPKAVIPNFSQSIQDSSNLQMNPQNKPKPK